MNNNKRVLSVSDLVLFFGNTKVLDQVSFSIPEGESLCILGPSGSGKTTLLRAIAGFESATAGTIKFGDQVFFDPATNLATSKRGVGFVFYDGALFPHLSVKENILFGAKNRQDSLYTELIDWLKIQDLQNRLPSELSAGQAQRVALARSLMPQPQILLLDEPFANLDIQLREQFRGEIKAVLKKIKTTAIFVTHDPIDAFEIADQVLLMNKGKAVQQGTPFDLYHEPNSKFVANFFGEAQFINFKYSGNGNITTELGTLSSITIERDEGQILVRPEDLVHDDSSPLKARVIDKKFRGSSFNYTLELQSGQKVLSLAPSHHNHPLGAEIGIRLEMDHLVILKS